MGISIYNQEHYVDPTPYEALKSEKVNRFGFRPLVYICSPFSGDIEGNIAKAREYCKFAVSQNVIPIAMHLLLPQFMDDNNEDDRALALFMNSVVLLKCQELWVFGEHISNGMNLEITKAKKRHIRIRYFSTDCKERSK